MLADSFFTFVPWKMPQPTNSSIPHVGPQPFKFLLGMGNFFGVAAHRYMGVSQKLFGLNACTISLRFIQFPSIHHCFHDILLDISDLTTHLVLSLPSGTMTIRKLLIFAIWYPRKARNIIVLAVAMHQVITGRVLERSCTCNFQVRSV